jgi:hypothetical protein
MKLFWKWVFGKKNNSQQLIKLLWDMQNRPIIFYPNINKEEIQCKFVISVTFDWLVIEILM